jgi:hypothetical protein
MEQSDNPWQGAPVSKEDIEAQFEAKRPVAGIGGWLAVFAVYLIVDAAYAGAVAFYQAMSLGELSTVLSGICFAAGFLYLFLLLLCAVFVIQKDKRFRKIFYIVIGVDLFFALLGSIPYFDLFWLIYLHRSERVKNTFS